MLRGSQSDHARLPENTSYKDTGCSYWHACLTCPFERCRYDRPMRRLTTINVGQIFEMHGSGMTRVNIAAATGVSKRTVYRVLKRGY